ncbi:shikimate 5-dehydrogenase [Candidatus Scalindua japonica]|uniref:Multifunctional fusion protein n=1 Tax=Candidatus Scalindua japonica TaxID=1284222 RepID=A0A286TXN3_9BACT|nr:shikimate dehydrogenase [Candidatus Scalindua japonica]GAX60642.1 shikimate 5-dehydrogenase [Candidatus Scalindua japonica]
MICIPITAGNVEDTISEMESASRYADIVELRIDYIPEIQNAETCVEEALKSKTKPVIITNRPVREGGKFNGSEQERLQLLQKAIELGADYVDVEHDSIRQITRQGSSKIIISHHNFEETPCNLSKIYSDICQHKPDIVKIVTYANDITDNIRIFELLQSAKVPTISLCMGELGYISRILTGKFGGFLTFASLERGKESAPGQLTVNELHKVYHFKDINNETKLYGIIGNPISHSMSPAIHNAAFIEKGLNNAYVPLKIENIGTFMKECRKIDFQGFSVTIPHKESVLPFLDDIDPTAGKIGAINTIVNRNGKLKGYNTDCMGAIMGLECSLKVVNGTLNNKKVSIIGAGGAARAIAFGLKEIGCDITIFNRTIERAEKLSLDVKCRFGSFEEIYKLETDILINTTSIGMFPDVDQTPVTKDVLKEGMIVFDAVYNPIETRLLRDAKEKECHTVNGLSMFINQAAEQFRLWTDIDPPVELMTNVVKERL